MTVMRSISACICCVRVIAIAALSAALTACANEALLVPLNWSGQGERIVVTTDLTYGADERQNLDVYRPADARNAPVMLFWYGGSWQHGANDYYGFVGAALARQGFVAILPNYRIAPNHPFPAFVEDAASAVRWARDHVAEYGGDPDRVFISGHSAGGHSALMLALDPRYLRAVGMAPQDLAGAVSLAGPTGLENLRGASLKGVFPLEMPYAAFSPIALAPSSAGAAPPFLLIVGLDDDVVRPNNVARLADAIWAGGGAVTVRAYPDTGHLGVLLGFSDLFAGTGKAVADIARFADL